MPTESGRARGMSAARSQNGMTVMEVIGKPRANLSARLVAGSAILAAVFTVGGANVSYAQTPAPIVYKSASPASAPSVRMESREAGAPIAVAPHAPIPTFANSSIQSEAVVKASFGPALITPAVRAPAGLASTAALAAPYAGPPYQVEGKWYVPAHEPNYNEVGIASWYGPTFHGKDSASGEVFDEMAMTAAHPTLPIPSLVRVTNLENGKTVVVRLNDRGPFVDDRIIDLSKAAGAALDMHRNGTAKVRVEYVGPAPADANVLPPAATVQKVGAVAAPIAPVAVRPVPAPIVQPAQQQGFFLQAGSFADLGNANVLRDRLRADGPVSISAVVVNGTEFYRVMVGPWATRTDAEQAQQRLGQGGAKSLIVARLD